MGLSSHPSASVGVSGLTQLEYSTVDSTPFTLAFVTGLWHEAMKQLTFPLLPKPLSSAAPLVEEDSELLDALPTLDARLGRLAPEEAERTWSMGTGTGTNGVAICLDILCSL